MGGIKYETSTGDSAFGMIRTVHQLTTFTGSISCQLIANYLDKKFNLNHSFVNTFKCNLILILLKHLRGVV